MSARDLRFESPNFIVSDDPEGTLGTFLGYATSSMLRPDLDTMFAKDGSGLLLPDVIAAYRMDDPTDVPPGYVGASATTRDSDDVWVVSVLTFGSAAKGVVIEGDELRSLLRRAVQLLEDSA